MMKNVDIQTVLWDIPPGQISTLPQQFVIQRALTYGGIHLITQIIKQHGLPAVRAVLHRMKPTAMPERKYYYFEHYLLA
ncbi:MAG: hypothetical protein ACD_41C00059G0001 [uncultured bacterium]|nr:MAG: hypothetical protein ACD_41C00059G0001 [uncultured bacterium]